MISYFILLTLLVAIALLVYKIFHDILSPTFISAAAFSLCTILAMVGLFSWNNVPTLSPLLITIIITGILSFFLGESLVRKKFPPQKTRKIKLKHISVPLWLSIASILFVVATIVLLYLNIKQVAAHYGFTGTGIGEMLSFYQSSIRAANASSAANVVDINFIVRQMRKVCDVLCIVSVYITVNNLFVPGKLSQKIKNILPLTTIIVLVFLMSLLTSWRTPLMHFFVSIVACVYFFILYRDSSQKTVLKLVGISGALVAAVLGIFYAISPLVGRSAADENFVSYVSFYLGTGIPAFEKTLENPPKHTLIGEKTFAGVYTLLAKFDDSFARAPSNQWTRMGNFTSNVYTSFSSFYFEFGLIGVIVLQFVFGAIASWVYLRAKTLSNPFITIIYINYFAILVDQIRDDLFFSSISSKTCIYLVLFYLATCLFLRQPLIPDSLKRFVGVKARKEPKHEQ